MTTEARIIPGAAVIDDILGLVILFVLMGMRVDLRAFARVEVLGLAAALTLAAIVGKQACSPGAPGKDLDRLSVGIGMIPEARSA